MVSGKALHLASKKTGVGWTLPMEGKGQKSFSFVCWSLREARDIFSKQVQVDARGERGGILNPESRGGSGIH